MELSIIIVSWNTCDLLMQCLESVIADTATLPCPNVEILVVDNASTDGTVGTIQQQFPQVCVIENDHNVGFAQANNQAIAQSKGRYVLLLNPDTEIKLGALPMLLDFMETELHIGLVGAQLLNADGSLQTSCYPAPTLLRELWRLFHLDSLYPYGTYRMTDWELTKPRQVDALLGACLLIRRRVLDEVGMLDEDYFMYSEEIDLCYRVRQAGWPIYWVPQAQIVHYGGQSTQQVPSKMFLHLYRSKLRYFRKHYGRFFALAYKFTLLAAAVTRLVLTPLVLLEKPAKRRRHLHLAGNYGRLIIALPGM
jgi:GT2 family glycosyltransferase